MDSMYQSEVAPQVQKRNIWEKMKESVYPQDELARKRRRSTYKNYLMFFTATGILMLYGKKISNLIYNQELLEEMIRGTLRPAV